MLYIIYYITIILLTIIWYIWFITYTYRNTIPTKNKIDISKATFTFYVQNESILSSDISGTNKIGYYVNKTNTTVIESNTITTGMVTLFIKSGVHNGSITFLLNKISSSATNIYKIIGGTGTFINNCGYLYIHETTNVHYLFIS
jgi:hypothetical protein